MDHVTTAEHTDHAEHGQAHHDDGFLRTYVFSVDHKVIGFQYAVTGLLFLMFGFTLMMIMRWQLAYPFQPIPIIGEWLGNERAPGGIMLPEFYNQLGAMHGTIMVFMGVVPPCRRWLWQLRAAVADRRAPTWLFRSSTC